MMHIETKSRNLIDSNNPAQTRLDEGASSDNIKERQEDEQHKDNYGEGGVKVMQGESRKNERKGSFYQYMLQKPLLLSQNGAYKHNLNQPLSLIKEQDVKINLMDEYHSDLKNPSKDLNLWNSDKNFNVAQSEDVNGSNLIGSSVQDEPEKKLSHDNGDQTAVKSDIDHDDGEIHTQSEGDWKFHFKQRDAAGVPQSDEETEIFHLEKRDAPVPGVEEDWKSRIAETQQKMPVLPANGTAESVGSSPVRTTAAAVAQLTFGVVNRLNLCGQDVLQGCT
ncbi:hypothetical protein RRG08_026433 [Elysia crispata]|uniref:Uncharacterized protein n=1 Tax=Elysia crispata TaxID=231223 RepID=A0AAE0Y480_9GAST|nr:hypothetical protein RRG08_026433 [Elysia crispata]